MRTKILMTGAAIATLLGATACTTMDPYSSQPRRNNTGTGVIAGAIGGAAGQQSLRALLTVVDTVLMGQPEIYFSYKAEAFDADGNVVDEKVKAFFETFIDRFATWIERTKEPVVDAQPDAQKID